MKAGDRQRGAVAAHAAVWIAANITAAAFYLYLAAKTWIEPELRGQEVARSGDAILWGITALPVALASFLADLILLALAVRLGLKLRDWSLFLVALGIGLGWGIVLAIDVTHRF